MGEKPLSIDESPAQARTIGGGGPLGGVDTPPPDMSGAASVVTRSNIKNGGSLVASPTDGGTDVDPDGAPAGMAAGGINTTRSNIKHSSMSGGGSGSGGSDTEGHPEAAGLAVKENGVKYDEGGTDAQATSAAAIGPVKPTPTNPPDPFPGGGGPAGIAIKEQGVKYGEAGDATPGADAPGASDGIQPIPGVDIVIKKNPPR